MATITAIDLSTANSGLGDPLRDGGSIVNTNFINLNTDKLETGGYGGDAQDLLDLININKTITITKANLTGGNTFTGTQSMGAIVSTSIATQSIVSVDPYEIGTSTGLTKNVDVDTPGQTLVFEGGILTAVTV